MTEDSFPIIINSMTSSEMEDFITKLKENIAPNRKLATTEDLAKSILSLTYLHIMYIIVDEPELTSKARGDISDFALELALKV